MNLLYTEMPIVGQVRLRWAEEAVAKIISSSLIVFVDAFSFSAPLSSYFEKTFALWPKSGLLWP